VVNVLGAGEFLAQGILDAYPGAPLGIVAARRVEDGGVSVEIYYERLPKRWEGPAIIADPMLATGTTVEAVARLLLDRGASPLVIASVIAAPEGLGRLSRLGDITVYTLAVDKGLNSNYFIVPGLGDAGDRGLGVTP
ncbi:MAG: uracil phosphoribosyltransferase, partial [Desulfurococcales archaeon]|nr:uracil phosphoribosyltransferase [Desulfurococcales archaeon]